MSWGFWIFIYYIFVRPFLAAIFELHEEQSRELRNLRWERERRESIEQSR